MNDAKFILSKKVLKEQVRTLQDLGLKISYSLKTNRVVGDVLQYLEDAKEVNFSIHAKEEFDLIQNKSRIWFFTQAESIEELLEILNKGITKFVVDNEVDLKRILEATKSQNKKIILSLRMKFQENRVGSGRYFVYGMPSLRVNELILELKDNPQIEHLGIHIHRKSQNTSEWKIKEELEDSLTEETLKTISFVNFGGGLPIKYISYTSKVFEYISSKLISAVTWLNEKGIVSWIEPGRFICGPCIKLETEIIQKYGRNLILNTTIYNCALDNFLTNTKMLVEGELDSSEGGIEYLLKGNSPTRDDIFRYNVKLPESINVGDKIVFLNAGAYNYTTDFFGYKKLETEIKDDF